MLDNKSKRLKQLTEDLVEASKVSSGNVVLDMKPIRFGELKKELGGITNTMLTSSLRELEQDGLVNRMQFNEIPPHVEYSLSDKGKDLLPVFYEMTKWGFKYLE